MSGSKGEAAWRCTAAFSCSRQTLEALTHFVGRSGFNIQGLGGKQLEDFWEWGWIRQPADIFRLEKKHGGRPGNDAGEGASRQLVNRRGWGRDSARNLFQSIRNSRRIQFRNFLHALGVRHIGQEMAERLARHYGDWPALAAAVEAGIADSEGEAATALRAIDGIGEVVATSLSNFFASNHAIVDDLLAVGIENSSSERRLVTNSTVSGKHLVFTGALAAMTRAEAQERARQLGAIVGRQSKQHDQYSGGGKRIG